MDLIGPTVSPSETPKISEKEMNKLLGETYTSLPKVVLKEGIKKKEVKMEIDKFSPNG